MMKFNLFYFIFFLIAFIALFWPVSLYKDRKILVSHFANRMNLSDDFLERYRHHFRKESLKNLYEIPEQSKHGLMKKAEEWLHDYQWQMPLATDYMQYFRIGNRKIYQDKIQTFNRRLSYLVVGQLLRMESNQTDNVYIDEIVNGVWMMMEQSTWIAPAHLHLQKNKDYLPDPENGVIDLYVGESAKLISWISFLLGKQFDRVTKAINKRIEYELYKRVFWPYLNHYQYWAQGEHVNNWNIWINVNIFRTALMMASNATIFNQIANKTFYSVDYYLNYYGDDGGCDEGPSYWRQDGGRLIEYVQLLATVYDQKKYFQTIQLIKDIGDFTYKMHIDLDLFVNFADALPHQHYPPALLFEYGKLYNDSRMKHFSSYMYKYQQKNYLEAFANKVDLNEFFNFLQVRKEIETLDPKAPGFNHHYYFPDLQVLTIGSAAHETKLFVGAKFGNNDEHHNHNDVGNFILYKDGQPIFIDIGVGVYNSTTFSSHRYDIFYFQSGYHNCPTINGYDQHYGPKYRSTNVQMHSSDDQITFTGNLAQTYPNNSKIEKWIRTINFDMKQNLVTLEDDFRLQEFLKPQRLNFITTPMLKYKKNSKGLLLYDDKNQTAIQMEFNWNHFVLNVEDRSFDGDPQLNYAWGCDHIRRLQLVTNEHFKDKESKFIIKFRPVFIKKS